jgi:hypothetical protein
VRIVHVSEKEHDNVKRRIKGFSKVRALELNEIHSK